MSRKEFSNQDFIIEVTSTTGTELNHSEIEDLKKSRASYAMWGEISEDFLFDEIDASQDTKIYKAIVFHKNYPDFKKIIYMRKSIHYIDEDLLPSEFSDWQFVEAINHNNRFDLSDILKIIWAHSPQFSVISRASSDAIGQKPENLDTSPMSGLAFAAIQLLATEEDQDNSEFWLTILNEALQKNILGFYDKSGQKIELDFTKAEDVIHIKRYRIKLKPTHHILEMKKNFVGYWLDRESLKKELEILINQNFFSLNDLFSYFPLKIPRNSDLITEITKPKNCKYLTKFFDAHHEIFNIIISKVEDGPFLALLNKKAWIETNKKVMGAEL